LHSVSKAAILQTMSKAFIRLLLLSATLLTGLVGQQSLAHGLWGTDSVVDSTATESSNQYFSSTTPQAMRRLVTQSTVSICCDKSPERQSSAGHCDDGHCNDAPQLLPAQGDMGFLAVANHLMSPPQVPFVAMFLTVNLHPPSAFPE